MLPPKCRAQPGAVLQRPARTAAALLLLLVSAAVATGPPGTAAAAAATASGAAGRLQHQQLRNQHHPHAPDQRRRILQAMQVMQAAAAGTASGSAAGGAAGKAQTLLSCHGFTPSLRSCLAHNLYYNVPGRYFAAVGMGEPGNEAFYNPQEEYSLDWVNVTALPQSTHISPNETLELPGLNVFWRWTNNGAGYSFGHALVHELFPMFITIDNLMMGHVPASFNLVTPNGGVPQALLHIAPAFQDRVFSWDSLWKKASDSGKPWIRVETATLDDGDMANFAQWVHYQTHPPPTVFNNKNWLRFRAWMFRSARVQQMRLPVKPLILLNDKLMQDGKPEFRRRIFNIEQITKELQGAFPEAEVMRVAFMSLSWPAQLELLGRTAVFITTEGSSSFRYVFLPPGASSIILSHPDVFTPGAEPRGEFAAFHEIDKYFPLTYVRFLKYRVDMAHRDEYVSSPTFENGKPQAEKYQLYNAHVIAKVERLKPMVQEAFRIYHLSRSVRSHHHSQQVHHQQAQRTQ